MSSAIAEEARTGHAPHRHRHDEPGCGSVVKVFMNTNEVPVHPGCYAVSTLKSLGGVPQADDLDELVDNTLRPLPDDGHVTIRGCEIFVSHIKDGGSA